MGNRSMFAKNKAQSNSLLNTAKIFYNSIRMEFEFSKCTIIIMCRERYLG